MWIADQWKDFELLDCSRGEKLERWGEYYLVRPDPQAIWDTPRRNVHWNDRDARYRRSDSGGGSWDKGGLPAEWSIRYKELTFRVKPMNFKHTGLFPEQAANWDWAMAKIRSAGRPVSVLNLFAYTGGATIACAKAGASVCHVDAAKGMVAWGKENAAASGVTQNLLLDVFGVKLSDKKNMLVARITVVGVAILGAIFASDPSSSIFRVVSFAWAGFGATFGPVMLLALFWKRCNRQGAMAGMIAGAVMIFVWKYLVAPLGGVFAIYGLLPAFVISALVIVVVSLCTAKPENEICAEFDAVKG